ncbi:hypothetical protein EVAR_101654_1 [Eumeta japonica]|uniref:Uncharacterized protein n=1 Tax=Eumeta variegata TaxID=151549 RepID=A0A4C1SAU5_EUMVA|nr:hypothetical protein EVAR_101654_1 [Eumeta japonica]
MVLQEPEPDTESTVDSLDNTIEHLHIEIDKLKGQLQTHEENKLILLQQFEEEKSKLLLNEKQNQQQLDNELENLKEKLKHQITKTEEIDNSFKFKIQEYENVIANKNLDNEKLNSELLQQKDLLQKNCLQNAALIEQYEKQLETQKAESELFIENSQKDASIKQQQIEELLSIQNKNKLDRQELEDKLFSISKEKQNITLEAAKVFNNNLKI